MRLIQVFDPALCCSSGVCGTDIDQNLVIFAGDAEWLKQQGDLYIASIWLSNLWYSPRPRQWLPSWNCPGKKDYR